MEWVEKDNALYKTFLFDNFIQAFAFMTTVAMLAEKANHHPDWSNCYNKVEIKLSTHDAGNIVTEKDHNLARLIDEAELKMKNR